MPLAGYSYRRTITINNSVGAALTNYPVRVRLTSANMTFAHAQSAGQDIRFNDTDDSTALKYWIESYDSSGQKAIIWVKVPSIGANTNYAIYLYYGNGGASDSADGPNTFSYYNGLSVAGDLSDLGSSFGTATWTVVTDAGSPTGKAVDAAIGTANDAAIYKSLVLPTTYAAEIYVYDAGGSSLSSRNGPLLNHVDDNNWLRGGSGVVTGNKDIQMRENVASTKTNRDTRAIDDALGLQSSTYNKMISIWKKKTVVTAGTTVSTSGTIDANLMQGIVWDGTDIWVCGSQVIARYNTSGVLQDHATVSPGGTSWGDMHYKGGKLYLCRFDETTPATKIYSLTNNANISAGVTLEANITANVDTSADGIVSDGTYWLIGETNSIATKQTHIYVFDASWNFVKSIVIPAVNNNPSNTGGIQCLELVGNRLYVTFHGDKIIECVWDNVNLEVWLSDIFLSGFSDTQGISWDSTNSRWYFCDRTNNRFQFTTLSQDATARTASVHYLVPSRSVSIAVWSQSSPGTQAKVGISAFRNSRFAQLFIRQLSYPEPLATTGSESPAGNRRRRSIICGSTN